MYFLKKHKKEDFINAVRSLLKKLNNYWKVHFEINFCVFKTDIFFIYVNGKFSKGKNKCNICKNIISK